jgi:hypothetical protein
MSTQFLTRILAWMVGGAAALAIGAGSAGATTLTQTYVSTAGSDGNSCAFTAPCKTFAGALPMTTAGGEIDVLDSGEYGTLTIDKALTIRAVGVVATITTGGDGLIINAGTGDSVNLFGLSLKFVGGGDNPGILVDQAAEVHIVNCTVKGYGTGILLEPGSPSLLLVSDTSLDSNGTGIIVEESGVATRAVIDHVSIVGTGTTGASIGVSVNGAAASAILNNSTIVGTKTGLVETNGGSLFSYGNNHVNYNGDNGQPNQPVLTQK